jgi:hypothetical protein
MTEALHLLQDIHARLKVGLNGWVARRLQALAVITILNGFLAFLFQSQPCCAHGDGQGQEYVGLGSWVMH